MPRRSGSLRDIFSTVEIDQRAIEEANERRPPLDTIRMSLRDIEAEAARRVANGEGVGSLRDAYDNLRRQCEDLTRTRLSPPETLSTPHPTDPTQTVMMDNPLIQYETMRDRMERSQRQAYQPVRYTTNSTTSPSYIRFSGGDLLDDELGMPPMLNYTWTGNTCQIGIDPGAEPPKPKPKPEPAYYMLRFGNFCSTIMDGKPGKKYHQYLTIRNGVGKWKLEFERVKDKQMKHDGKDKIVVVYELCNVFLAKPEYDSDDEVEEGSEED